MTRPGDIARSLRGLSEPAKVAVDAALAASRRPLTLDSLPKWQKLADTLLRASTEGSAKRERRRAASQDAAAYSGGFDGVVGNGTCPGSSEPADVVRALAMWRFRPIHGKPRAKCRSVILRLLGSTI